MISKFSSSYHIVFKKVKIARLMLYIILILAGLMFFFPFFWMISTAFKRIEQCYTKIPVWIPKPIILDNFKEALKWIPLLRQTLNTVYISFMGAIGTTIASSLSAYGFSKVEWPGRDILFTITLSTMMIPFSVYMIPLYIIYRNLGFLGSFLPLWLPYWFGGAFNIFLLTQFFKSIPKELSDAARIDGCSEFDIFWRIIIPLSRTALALVFIFHVVFMWKEFFLPFLYLPRQDMWTLSIGLQALQGGTIKAPWNVVMAAATLISTPLLLIFIFAQRIFIEGIMMTGIKG